MEPTELFSPEPPQRRPRGSCGPLVLGLAIGCGGMLLLCCGGLVGSVWFLGNFVVKAFDTDPFVVQKTTVDIADIEIPPQFEPEVTFVADFPVVGLVGKGVIYQAREGAGILVLADVDAQKIGMTQEQITEELRREAESRLREAPNFEQQPQVPHPELPVGPAPDAPEQPAGQPPEPPAQPEAEPPAKQPQGSSEVIEVTIRGKKSEFQLYRVVGEGNKPVGEYWQVVGSWEGRIGSGFLVLEMPTDRISREEIIKMLRSIH